MQIDLAKYSDYEITQILHILESDKFQANNFARDLLNYCRPILYTRIEFSHLIKNFQFRLLTANISASQV